MILKWRLIPIQDDPKNGRCWVGEPLGNADQNAECRESEPLANWGISEGQRRNRVCWARPCRSVRLGAADAGASGVLASGAEAARRDPCLPERKSTRLNSSHANISYAVF